MSRRISYRLVQLTVYPLLTLMDHWNHFNFEPVWFLSYLHWFRHLINPYCRLFPHCCMCWWWWYHSLYHPLPIFHGPHRAEYRKCHQPAVNGGCHHLSDGSHGSCQSCCFLRRDQILCFEVRQSICLSMSSTTNLVSTLPHLWDGTSRWGWYSRFLSLVVLYTLVCSPSNWGLGKVPYGLLPMHSYDL